MKGLTPILGLFLGLLLLPTQAKTTSEIEQLEKPCHTGEECFILGVIYDGGGISGKVEAVKYYRKACTLNNGKGCHNLGVMYENGSGVKQSNFEAVEYYRKACTLEKW